MLGGSARCSQPTGFECIACWQQLRSEVRRFDVELLLEPYRDACPAREIFHSAGL